MGEQENLFLTSGVLWLVPRILPPTEPAWNVESFCIGLSTNSFLLKPVSISLLINLTYGICLEITFIAKTHACVDIVIVPSIDFVYLSTYSSNWSTDILQSSIFAIANFVPITDDRSFYPVIFVSSFVGQWNRNHIPCLNRFLFI